MNALRPTDRRLNTIVPAQPTRVGAMIRQAREAQFISASELGRRLNVDHSTVSHWEHGQRRPNPDLVQPIADALGIDAADLALAVCGVDPEAIREQVRAALWPEIARALVEAQRAAVAAVVEGEAAA